MSRPQRPGARAALSGLGAVLASVVSLLPAQAAPWPVAPVPPPAPGSVRASGFGGFGGFGSGGARPVVPGDDGVVVQVLTFGPGDHPFTKFGHNAIRVLQRPTNTDVVYNFGTFTFESPVLILDFLQGKLQYWLSRSSYRTALRAYVRENRDVATQELDLPLPQKLELARRLEVNALPENSHYRYDYFGDNCSTRVRDALDGVLGGKLRATANGPARMTLRAHALRMAADNLPLYTALLIVLGPRTDRSIDRWAEDFLPEELQRHLRAVTLDALPAATATATATATGGAESSGGATVPLVKRDAVVWKADRAPVAAEAPRRAPAFFAVGAVAGILFLLLGWAASHAALARLLFGLLVASVGFAVGFIGCFLVLSWALTPHVVVYGNQNSLLFAPFAIALLVLGFGVVLGRPGAIRKAARLAVLGLVLAVVGCAVKVLPLPKQDNAALIAMMLPFWLGLTLGTRRLRASTRHRET